MSYAIAMGQIIKSFLLSHIDSYISTDLHFCSSQLDVCLYCETIASVSYRVPVYAAAFGGSH